MGSDISADALKTKEKEVYGDITLRYFGFEHLDEDKKALPNYGDV